MSEGKISENKSYLSQILVLCYHKKEKDQQTWIEQLGLMNTLALSSTIQDMYIIQLRYVYDAIVMKLYSYVYSYNFEQTFFEILCKIIENTG